MLVRKSMLSKRQIQQQNLRVVLTKADYALGYIS